MRTKLGLRPLYLAGAMTIAIPASAFALAQGQSLAESAPQLTVSPQHIPYGGEVTVSGTTSSTDSGQQLVLAYQQPGTQWRPIANTNVQSDGSFRFVTRPSRSGLLNVLTSTGSAAFVVATVVSVVEPPAVSTVSWPDRRSRVTNRKLPSPCTFV